MFCHDKVSSHDLYVPDAHFHRTAHDPVDIILSASVDNFQTAAAALDSDGHAHHFDPVASRDVPFNRKENATIVFLERTNRPLVRTYVDLWWLHPHPLPSPFSSKPRLMQQCR